jgi:hypothetical protein
MPTPVYRKKIKIPVRTSERKDFMICHQWWWWAYVENMKPKQASKPLVFGDLCHQALGGTNDGQPGFYIPETAKRRRRGPHPADTFKRLVLETNVDFRIRTESDEEEDMLELGQAMLSNYVALYGKDLQWVVLYPEMPFQLDIYDDDGKYICTYVGKTDALVQDLNTMRLGLLEHKTARSIPRGTLWNNEQSTSYWTFVPAWLWEHGILPKDQDLDFMLFNFLRKAKGDDDRPKNDRGQYLNKPPKARLQDKARELGFTVRSADKVEDLYAMLESKGVDAAQLGDISKSQGSPLFERKFVSRGIPERVHLLERVKAQALEMKELREGKRLLYKSPGDHCENWCPFNDVCELHEAGADWQEMMRMTFRKWDPYEDHREVVY